MRNKVKSLVTVVALVVAFMVTSMPQVEAANNNQRNLYQKVFDYNYYATAYPDVVAAVGNNSQSLLDHYINTGAKEGRSASEFFNLLAYAKRYPDLLAAFGTDLDKYVYHYVTVGAAQGLNASASEAGPTPQMQENIIRRIGSLAGTCTTVYDWTIARAKNVELATSKINGVTLQPGQTFSYNKTVGPRTKSAGFVDAPIFISGQHGVGIGGGICQVSSTLYTAMNNAQIPATERHAHSLPVSYLPAGYDATISGDYFDLKFKNTYDRPLYISATASGGYLTISLILL